jgi:CheY-like chemotaxis protein
MRTLLLVEDDDAFRYAAARHLTAAGFKVVAVMTTMKALAEVDSGRHIDAFIVDVAMPSGNPHGVAFSLMMRHRLPATPILLTTAFPDILRDDNLPGKVLVKPLSLDKLTEEIEALFPKRPSNFRDL